MSELKSQSRIDVVDVLRGFAVMAIMLLHNIERFNLYIFPGGWAGMSELDRGIWDSLFFLFGGKTYSIFALLFGFTFYLMFEKERVRGKDFGGRFLWRLLLLAAFACINAAFFPGEVLMLYAVVGIVLVLVRKWNSDAILILAILLLIQPMELYYFIRSISDAAYELPQQINSGMHGDVRAYLNEGTFWALVKGNTTIGQAWSMMWAIENGRFLQTAGLFLVGLLIGRNRIFENLELNKRLWFNIFMTAFAASVIFYVLRLNFFVEREFIYRRSIGVAIDMWWKLSFTFIWVSLFAILYRLKTFVKLTRYLKSYGRMSLTNYISQSIIGSFLYFPFALDLAPKVGITASLGIGVVLFILQISFCNWWISRFRQGPLEKLWHKLTWLGK